MRIPDGDLMPARRHRYGGSGYGRRRRRRVHWFAVLALAVLVAGALGLWITRKGSPAVVVAPCPTPSEAKPSPLELPRAQDVRLRLLNGTPRQGLAASVAGQLGAQGFVVLSQGNASAAVGGASQVTYGPGGLQAARLVSFHVLGSVVAPDPSAPAGVVTVVLGGDFQRLATPTEVAAAVRSATGPAAVPRPSGATPTRSCRA